MLKTIIIKTLVRYLVLIHKKSSTNKIERSNNQIGKAIKNLIKNEKLAKSKT